MPRGSNKTSVALLVALTLLVRGGVLWLTPDALAGDPDGYRQVAENLLDHGVLGHGDVPTARRPPLYPLLLSACLALGPGGRAAIGLVHLGLGLATVLLVYRLGRQCGLGRFALLAAAMVACDPILLRQSTQVMTETLAAALTALGLTALCWAARRPTPVRAALAGGALALAALCRPELLVWGGLAAVLLPMAVAKNRGNNTWRTIPSCVARWKRAPRPSSDRYRFRDRKWPQRLALFGSMAAAGALVLCPWAVRNWIRLGRPIVTTTHGGYTLLLGNNPLFYEHLRRGGAGEVWDAGALHEAWRRRLLEAGQPGEVAADRLAYADARATMAGQPATFLYASIVRAGRLWQLAPRRLGAEDSVAGFAARRAIGAWYSVELALAALGLWAISRGIYGGRPTRWLLLWAVLLAGSLTAVHLLYWTNMRMRAPLAPAAALAAAAGTASLVERVARRGGRIGGQL